MFAQQFFPFFITEKEIIQRKFTTGRQIQIDAAVIHASAIGPFQKNADETGTVHGYFIGDVTFFTNLIRYVFCRITQHVVSRALEHFVIGSVNHRYFQRNMFAIFHFRQHRGRLICKHALAEQHKRCQQYTCYLFHAPS